MIQILIQGPGGIKKVNEGEPYVLGLEERIIGAEGTDSTPDVQGELLNAGIQWGDAVAWVTKRFGIRHCSSCQARREILNRMNELGLKEVIRRIKETL